MASLPSFDELDASYQALRDLISHPEFKRVLEDMQHQSPVEGLRTALTQMTPEALAARGIPIPANCTITTQVSQEFSVSSTADGATREHGASIKGLTRVCVGICPACICWNF